MSWIKNFAPQIYSYITGYLPWSYVDSGHTSTIDVIKTKTGLRVITTDKGVDGTGYREIIVDVPQDEIQNLMKR